MLLKLTFSKVALQKLLDDHQVNEETDDEYFGVGLEAGYSSTINPETNEEIYFLFTWAAVVNKRSGHVSFGCSAKAPFSGSLLEKMKENTNAQKEMKEVLASVSGIENIATKQGGIHLLTDGALTRQQANELALHCALSHYVSHACIH